MTRTVWHSVPFSHKFCIIPSKTTIKIIPVNASNFKFIHVRWTRPDCQYQLIFCAGVQIDFFNDFIVEINLKYIDGRCAPIKAYTVQQHLGQIKLELDFPWHAWCLRGHSRTKWILVFSFTISWWLLRITELRFQFHHSDHAWWGNVSLFLKQFTGKSQSRGTKLNVTKLSSDFVWLLRRIPCKLFWSSCVRFTFANLLRNTSNIRAHSIDTYLFVARKLDISIYPWFALRAIPFEK